MGDCDKSSSYYSSFSEKSKYRNVNCGNINDFTLSTLKKDYKFAMSGRSFKVITIKTTYGGTEELFLTQSLEDYNWSKLFNAFKYLIAKAQEGKIYKRSDSDDPFSPDNFNQIDVQSLSSNKLENTCSVPITLDGDLHIVNIKIGNIENYFILDSGASDISISEDLEQRLVNSGFISMDDYLANGLYKLADGSIRSCKRVQLKALIICNFKVNNVIASISNNSSPLLLGKSFFNKFKKWSIDNSTSTLRLEK